MRLVATWLFLIPAFALPAEAQTPNPLQSSPEIVARPTIPDAKTLASNYELASGSGDRKCTIILDTKPAGPGFALTYNRAECNQLFGFLNETLAWLPGVAGSIRFVNGAKRTVTEFTEGVGGQYEALRDGDGVYFLSNLQIVEPSDAPKPADVVGDWNLVRPGGGAICTITLTEQSIKEDTFAVTVKNGCDQSIARFAPVVWFLDRGDIILLSAKDERMRFGRQQEGGWAKIPDTPRPLLLARP
jgi:hypothetical protein